MTVSLPMLIGIYAMWPLAGILGLWLYDEWKFRRTPFVPSRKETVTCEICLHQFFCDKDTIIVRCPQCGSLNKRKPA